MRESVCVMRFSGLRFLALRGRLFGFRSAPVHPQLAFDEVLQRGVFADELARLHVFLAETGKENLCCAGAVAIVVDVDVAVRCLRDVGVGDVDAFV